jgi:hypothetical protein
MINDSDAEVLVFARGPHDPNQRGGAIVGTPSHMAAEQASGRSKEIGRPADIA